jgi:hypothetical protein
LNEIRGGDADLRKRGVPLFGAESAGLDNRDSPAAASLTDVFMGEENANADTVDLQNVVTRRHVHLAAVREPRDEGSMADDQAEMRNAGEQSAHRT